MPTRPLPHPATRVVTLVASVALLLTATLGIAGDGRAAGSTDGARVDSVADLVPDDGLDPRIHRIELTGASWRSALDRLDAALFAQAENAREIAATTQLLDELAREHRRLDETERTLETEAADAAVELAHVEAILQARALERYVHFGDDPLGALEDPANAVDQGRSEQLAQRVDEVQISTRRELLEQRDTRKERLASTRARLQEVEVARVATTIRRDEAITAQEPAARDVESAKQAVWAARRGSRVPGHDFSVVALDAYLDAESLLAASWGSCRIRWWMIAGVARIESRHGQIGGRSIQAAGRPSRPIIGIALDGGPGVRAMYDTDDGRLDGDTVWDRAVGPLQFIPETWARRGRDGSGDGVADPQNIYDAAYSAGRYLCAIGGDLSARANLRQAYFGYNNSTAYVDAVISWADRYAALEL